MGARNSDAVLDFSAYTELFEFFNYPSDVYLKIDVGGVHWNPKKIHRAGLRTLLGAGLYKWIA